MLPIDKFKLSSVVWDSDKNPTGFTKWMSDFSALVASVFLALLSRTVLLLSLPRVKDSMGNTGTSTSKVHAQRIKIRNTFS